MTAWAWVAILAASNLTNIVWRVGLHRDAPLWTLYVRLILLGALWLAGVRLSELRALRPYLLALVAVLVGLLVKDVIYNMPAVTKWIGAAPWRGDVVSSVLKLLPVAAMALTVMDLSRRELFLLAGDVRAPGRVPFTGVTLSWVWSGLGLILLAGGLLAGSMVIALRPSLRPAPQILALVPTVLLARLQPHVGADQALWMTSVRFGLGHWFGNPSGLRGTVGATLLGLMLGKSMLETKGFFWAWFVHFTLDVVIFSVLILGSPRV